MAQKKPVVEPAKKSNKFRLVVFEGDMSDSSVTEIAHALSAALRPTAPPVIRHLQNGKPAAQLIAPEPEADEQVEEEEQILDGEPAGGAEEEAASQVAAPKKPSRPKKSKPPQYLHHLVKDEASLRAFAAEKKPSSKAKQYLTAMYWLKEHNATPTANMDMIYTFYKTAGWSVNFNDWNQPFHNLLFDDLIRKGTAKGEYAINPTGEAVVKSLPE